MSHTAISPSEALHRFTLTQEQVLNIAASLASDLGSAADLMPGDFLQRHYQLLDLFLAHLSDQQKLRVLGAISTFEVPQ